MKEPTVKQKDVFEFIKSFKNENEFSPTYREIGERFSITVKGAYGHAQALKKKGYIDIQPGKARAIKIINHFPDAGEKV